MYLGFRFILITKFNDYIYSFQEHKSNRKLHYNKDIGTHKIKICTYGYFTKSEPN